MLKNYRLKLLPRVFSRYFGQTNTESVKSESNLDLNSSSYDLLAKYYSLVKKGDITENTNQIRVVKQLQESGSKFLTHIDLLHRYRKSLLNRPNISSTSPLTLSAGYGSFWDMFSSKSDTPAEEENKESSETKVLLPAEFQALETTRNVYLHGNPGTGKTYIMDMMYSHLPIKKKLRLHYNEFMLQIHEREHKINTQTDRSVDTITKVGDDFCKDIDLLGIDEFQVLHISDAMILKRLFESFDKNHLGCMLTSNRPPEDLYLNGLQRFLFMPFIEMVRQKMEVVTLDGIDYRIQNASIFNAYFYPNNEESKKQLQILWDMITNKATPSYKQIKVAMGRSMTLENYHNEVAIVDFSDLGEHNLSDTDYRALAENVHTLILTNVPTITINRRDLMRRFIWLIDELYDRKVRLYMSCATDIDKLYLEKDTENMFDEHFAWLRICSRLQEMRTERYIKNSKAKDGLMAQ